MNKLVKVGSESWGKEMNSTRSRVIREGLIEKVVFE